MNICLPQSCLCLGCVEQILLWLTLMEERSLDALVEHENYLSTLSPHQVCIMTLVKPLANAGCCLQIKLPQRLAHLLSPFFSGFPSLFACSCFLPCCTNVLSMRCLISVHISPVRGNNKSQLTSSINKMYYYPSAANERKVCLAHACNNDMPGAAILLLKLSGKDSFLA